LENICQPYNRAAAASYYIASRIDSSYIGSNHGIDGRRSKGNKVPRITCRSGKTTIV